MNHRQILGTLMAVLVVVSVFAGGATGAAGTITVDTETTETASVSEIQADTVLDSFDANASNTSTVQVESDSNDTKVELLRNGSTFVAAVNSTGTVVSHNASGAENSYLNHSFSHNELADVEHAAGENVTMDLVAYNNTTSATIKNITKQWYLDWDNATATETINDTETGADSLAVPTNESGLLALDKDHTTVSLSNRNAPNDTFYVVAANGTVADDLSSADTNADSEGSLSSAFSPGANAFVKISSSDETVFAPVFASESDVPSEITDNNRTHAVVKSVGGTTGMAIHLGDEFTTSDTLDIELVAGTGTFTMNVQYIQAAIGNVFSMTIGAAGAASVAVVPAFGLFAIPRRRRSPTADTDTSETAGHPGESTSRGEPATPAGPDRPPTTTGTDDASSAPRDRGGV